MNYCFLPSFHGDACLKLLGGQHSLQLFSKFWYFCTFHQLMAAILIGGLMDSVRRPVEVVCKQKLDLAPIPRHKMVGEIVAVLDLPLLLENATGIHVRVSPILFLQDFISSPVKPNRINALQ